MKTKADPTGQGKRRKRAARVVINRLNKAERQIKALFRDIPRKRRTKSKIVNNTSTTIYDYDLSARDFDAMANNVQIIVSRELLESNGEQVTGWYWETQIEPSYRQGTFEEINVINHLKTGLPIADVVPDHVVMLSAYRENIARQFSANFTTFKGLSDKTSQQVIRVIQEGVQSGLRPTAIGQQITERFDVARSSANRIARTEINKSYTDGKMETGQIIADQVGLRTGVIHISALTSTTRSDHARRHGNAYTREDQQQWWSEGANRIHCLCDVQTVLIDRSGNVVDTQFQEKIQVERKFFD